ncbi:ATP-binding protein [Methylobacterium aerolatum]|uniref:ORC1/DEAH AAA+ ATPase domain-containing protein n=1 Tax=Methylobacterium aerolatum TaxID=418708 RepID=A0ABU0HXJ2_9HYPH|nr:ATP-binding protein [Methylobacterium aerolatum]MDQ0447069.1 hypothetical protein [Methylobacterium aerolatum]GJD37230.1 hypothetical protein FMGBMHLM_4157 [Methylobacterium aerolatum]
MTGHPGDEALAWLASTLDPDEIARLRAVERAKACFLETDRDEDVAKKLRWLLRNLLMRADPSLPLGPGNRREARCVVVVGESGAGKTRLLRRTFHAHPAFPGYGIEGSGCTLVSVDVPSPCTLLQLGRRTLAALGYPLQREMKEHLIWERVRLKLRTTGTVVLHFDEVHNLLDAANSDDVCRIRKTLKALLVDPAWPVGLIVSGLPGIAEFLETLSLHALDDDGNVVPLDPPPADRETELRRRCRVVELTALVVPADLEMITMAVGDIAKAAGLELHPSFGNDVASRLAHAALYQLGTALELAAEAVEAALEPVDDEDEGILQDGMVARAAFAAAYRERTACGPDANPFLAAEWWRLDCKKVLRTKNEPDALPRLPRKPANRKR